MRLFKFIFVFLLSITVLWLAGYGVFILSVLSQKADAPEEKTDAIIVLTGGDYRIKTGLDLFATGLAPKLFISGVHDGTTIEAIVAGWPGLAPNGKRNLPACCMEVGNVAKSTIENAIETREWVRENDIRSARLVTSPYHMPRALLEFHNLMPELEIYKYPVTLDPLSPRDEFFWHITFSEYHKTIYRYAITSIHGL